MAIGTVVFVSVLGEEPAADDKAKSSCASTDSGASATAPGTVAQGVSPGQRSRPMRSQDARESSGYRSPDRPGHLGVDLAGPEGAPIFAAAEGTVVAAGAASGFGFWIVIDHNVDGEVYSTVYGHMWENGLLVSAGQSVVAGQHIANEGSAGESTGPHLHFEVWKGGKFSGGSDIDPNTWIDGAAEPGSASPVTTSPTAPTPTTTVPPTVLAADHGTEMAALPESVGSEAQLQVDTIRVARAVHTRFPQIATMYGWREDTLPYHPNGIAVDVMIPDHTSDSGRALGEQILDYLWTHREQFELADLIWRGQYIPVDGERQAADGHFDHIHVTTEGHGLPVDGQTYGAAPELDGSTSPAPTSAASTTCSRSATQPGGGLNDDSEAELADGAVPTEFVRWLKISARQCSEISPALLGAQIKQESGFVAGLTSRAGAQGYTQFMPDTWAAYGRPVDEDGNPTGPAGSGDPNDLGDAVMAQGAYMCDLAEQLRPSLASGAVQGDPTELMLAAYNAGPGNVESYGGVPPFAETQHYVQVITTNAKLMEAGIAQ
ncbi:peptidoglycan DD-metalloendopeptidase family protein [Nocardia sp. NPDC060249]|uniref:peptidoglycan DD-metalloendopeptidase family protein n=1 Tax=Nocardia sp. NPDC060249 TaxID=3347082 RepID=UPI00365455BC